MQHIIKYVVIILFCTFSMQAQDCNHVIRGRLTDAETKEAIAFASVFVKETKANATTDEQGFYNISNICNGTFTLEISHIECYHETRQVHIHDEGAVIDVVLHHHEGVDLQEVSISAQAIEAKKTQANSTLEGAALASTRGQSLGDALKNLVGVTTLNTGATVAKPVIQGMHSNRILIFNNGVRQEGQQWGLDHAPEIDAATADKLTVVKGAGSVIYGADAIGGIVLVEPKAMRWQEGLGGKLNLGVFSNGRIGSAALMLEGCQFCHTNGFKTDDKRKFSWRLQGSLKRGGNLKTTNYYLANTGIAENNFSGNIEHRGNKTSNSFYFSQFYTKIAIFAGAHIGNLDDLKKAFTASEPLIKANFSYDLGRPQQQVTHRLLKYKNAWQISDEKRLVTQFSMQRNERGEFDKHRSFGNLSSETDVPNMDFDLWTSSINSTLEHHISQNIHGKIGAEFTYQNNQTEKGGLIPSFVSTNFGAFATERWHRSDSRFELESGIRYDYKWLNARVRKTSSESEGNLQQFDFQSVAENFGIIYKLKPTTFFTYNMATAWRAPTVNELFSLGVHHGTASFERGNVNLKSERSFNNTFSFVLNEKRLKTQIDFYHNFIKNYIYLCPDSVSVLTIRGAFPAFNYAQNDAQLTGLDVFIDYNFYKKFSVETKASWLHANNLNNAEPLILMPANRVQMNLKYNFLGKETLSTLENTTISVGASHVFEQKRVPPNQDYVAPPKAYTLWNIAFSTTVLIKKQAFDVHLQMTNLTNVAYRDYLNRFRYFADEIGRDIQVKVQYIY